MMLSFFLLSLNYRFLVVFIYKTFAKMFLFAVWHTFSIAKRNIDFHLVAVATLFVVNAIFDIATYTFVYLFHFIPPFDSILKFKKNIKKLNLKIFLAYNFIEVKIVDILKF